MANLTTTTSPTRRAGRDGFLFTEDDLGCAWGLLSDAQPALEGDWRLDIECAVHLGSTSETWARRTAAAIEAAVAFYCGTEAAVEVELETSTGCWLQVKATGYRNGPAGC